MNAFSKLYFRPGEGELIETVVRPTPDSRCAVCGTVVDGGGAPVPEALVLLFDAGEEPPRLLSGCFTEESGAFAFGPLTPGRLYFLRGYKSEPRLRRLNPAPPEPDPAASSPTA